MSSSLITPKTIDEYSNFFRQSSARSEGVVDVLFERSHAWENRGIIFELIASNPLLILKKFNELGGFLDDDTINISMNDVVSFRTVKHQGKECISMKTTATKLTLRFISKDEMNNWLFTFQRSVALVSQLLSQREVLGKVGTGAGASSKWGNSTPRNNFTRKITHEGGYHEPFPPRGSGDGSAQGSLGLASLGKGLPGSSIGDTRFAFNHGKHTDMVTRRNSFRDGPLVESGSEAPPRVVATTGPTTSPLSIRGVGGGSLLSQSLSTSSSLSGYLSGSGSVAGSSLLKSGNGSLGLGGAPLTRSNAFLHEDSPPPSSSPSLLSLSLNNSHTHNTPPNFVGKSILGSGLGPNNSLNTSKQSTMGPGLGMASGFSSTVPKPFGLGGTLLTSSSNLGSNGDSLGGTGLGLGWPSPGQAQGPSSSSDRERGRIGINSSSTTSSGGERLSISIAKSPAILIHFLNPDSSSSPVNEKLAGSYQQEEAPPPIRLSPRGQEEDELDNIYDASGDSSESDASSDQGEEGVPPASRGVLLGNDAIYDSDGDGNGTWRDRDGIEDDDDLINKSNRGSTLSNRGSTLSNRGSLCGRPSDLLLSPPTMNEIDMQFQFDDGSPRGEVQPDHINDGKISKRKKDKTRVSGERRLSSPSSLLSSSPSSAEGDDAKDFSRQITWISGSCSRLGPRSSNEDRFVCISDLNQLIGGVRSDVFGSPSSLTGEHNNRLSSGGRLSNSSNRTSFSGNSNNNNSSGKNRKKEGHRSPPAAQSPPNPEGFFGVYDGHCGDQASVYLQKQLHLSILSHPKYSSELEKAILDACVQLDQECLDMIRRERKCCGSTALGALIKDGKLTVFNIGDCHSVVYLEGDKPEGELPSLCVDPDPRIPTHPPTDAHSDDIMWSPDGGRVIEMSNAHKPGREDERARIATARGWITEEKELYMGRLHIMDLSDPVIRDKAQKVNWVVIHRVCGELAISRSIGDPDYKGFVPGQKADAFFLWPDEHDQVFMADLVIPIPEFRSLPLTPGLRFMILASDGLWDVLSAQEAVQSARASLARGLTPDQASSELCDLALRLGSADNVTTIIVQFHHPSHYI